jgi:chromosome segregation ATPase
MPAEDAYMSRLDAALTRFNAALDSLEAGVKAASAAKLDSAATEQLAREAADLKREREELLSRIAVLEEESDSLTGLTEAVETRLDGAISEIRAALGRG